MDKEILIQYCEMKEEIKDIRKRIANLEKQIERIEKEGTVKDTVSGGMGGIQHYVIEGFPLPEYSRKKRLLRTRKALLEEKEAELLELTNQAEEYIQGIEKSELRIMFRLYYIDGLTWILEDNFGTGDMLIRLSYKPDQKPEDKEEMQKKIRHFFRKMRREYKKLGMEMKYVHVFEVGKRGAWHHHLVLNNIDIRIIQKCWEYGYIHTVPLDDTGEYSKLANYLMKFAGRNVGKYTGKSYTHSKNLTIPKPVKKIISGRDAFSTRPQAKKGYWIPADMIREGTTEDGYRFIEYVQIATERNESG